ncbi:MAG TPA: alpha/beta fold hydrolase [Verrucomicrobiae bacterium]|nr:alpha/beta fold hydrolase [Verrucomicrobiae bacterium]
MAAKRQVDRRRLLILGLTALGLFAALNSIAYHHAWRMTHFVPAGSRTESPQRLSLLGKLVVLSQGVEIPKPEVGVVQPDFPQPARTVTFRARDGVKLEAWDIPAAPERGVVAMFHGYADSRQSLLGEARVLHDLSWRTVLVDFRGSGGSEGLMTTLGWCEAEDVAAAASWARREWPGEHLLLFGQSMGAAAVLRAIAKEGVTADGIILECPFDKLLTTVGHRYHWMGLPAFPFAELLVFWGGVQHGFNAFEHNPVSYAAAVTCPALVLDGAHDPWVMPAEARRVAAALRGPTQCHIFRDGGHGGYWRDVAGEYRKVIGEWVAAIPANRKIGNGK